MAGNFCMEYFVMCLCACAWCGRAGVSRTGRRWLGAEVCIHAFVRPEYAAFCWTYAPLVMLDTPVVVNLFASSTGDHWIKLAIKINIFFLSCTCCYTAVSL